MIQTMVYFNPHAFENVLSYTVNTDAWLSKPTAQLLQIYVGFNQIEVDLVFNL